MMKKHSLLIILCIFIFAIAIIYLYFRPSAQPEQPTTVTTTNSDRTIAQNNLAPESQTLTEHQILSDYSAYLPRAEATLKQDPLLNGTEILANWSFDENGQLIINTELKDTFDYLLVIYPKVGQTGVMALAQDILNKKQQDMSLSTTQQQINKSQVFDSFDHYIDYLAKAENISMQMRDENFSDTERLAFIHKLRIQYLGPELAKAFFADQEAYDTQQLELIAELKKQAQKK